MKKNNFSAYDIPIQEFPRLVISSTNSVIALYYVRKAIGHI